MPKLINNNLLAYDCQSIADKYAFSVKTQYINSVFYSFLHKFRIIQFDSEKKASLFILLYQSISVLLYRISSTGYVRLS